MSNDQPQNSAITVPIKVSELQHYECAALLFSYLAFPKATEEKERMRAHAVLCYRVLNANAEADEDWASSPHLIKPVYLLQDTTGEALDRRPRQRGRGRPAGPAGTDPLLTFNRRMRDRAAAVAIAKPFFQLAMHGLDLRPAGTLADRFTLVMPLVVDGKKGGEDKNVSSRIWLPSLPVLHLAVAVAGVLEALDRKGEKCAERFPVLNFLRWPETAPYLVNAAQDYERLIALTTDRPLAQAGKSLIRFRLA